MKSIENRRTYMKKKANELWFKMIFYKLIFCIISTILVFNAANCHAKNKKAEQFSKDYKAYPAGSPEDVVTKFIEYADLAKGAHRDDGDRYPLFWSLTETSFVPEDAQKLIIKSYSINGKSTLPSGDVIVNLKLDVRAISERSCDSKPSGYNKQLNNCKWRDRTVLIHNSASNREDRVSAASTDMFMQYVFGNSDLVQKIIYGKNSVPTPKIYAVPKATRIWEFEIRLVKKKGKWLISQDSVPIQLEDIDGELIEYKELVNKGIEITEICEGKRIPDKNSFYFDKESRQKKCKAREPIAQQNKINLSILETAEEN